MLLGETVRDQLEEGYMPSVLESETAQHIIWMLDLSCEAVQDNLLQRISPVLVDYEQ